MDILKKPILTEKVSALTEKLNRYAFVVHPKANKVQIKSAIASMYGVNVEAVNTILTQGKPKTRQTKTGAVSGRTNKIKKAIITLKAGETIDFYN